MIKRLPAILLGLFCILQVSAQHGVSFYHLRDATFQNTAINPAYFPKGKVFVGLPGMSGVNFFVSSPLSYNDLFSPNESGGTDITISNAISKLQIANNVSSNVRVNLFHFGLRLKSGRAFSLFSNLRSETDLVFPKELMEWAWEGNATVLGSDVNVGSLGLTSNTFYEVGVGYAHSGLDGKFKYGARLKMYQGLVNASTPSFFSASFRTDPENFQLNLDVRKSSLRTAGLEVLQGNEGDLTSYLISNSNKGIGIDAGFDYRINQYYGFALSVSDFGFINWSEGILNRQLNDTTFRYIGIELKGADDVAQAVQDSLLDKFNLVENNNSYTSMMVASITGSWTWYSPYAGIDMTTTVNTRIIQGQPKMMYGLGIRKDFGPKLVLSASANKLPQQFFNIGAALSATAGVVQFYVASDRTINYSVPSMKWAEFRVGMNIVIGSGRNKRDKGPAGYTYKNVSDLSGGDTEQVGVTTSSFMGDPVKPKKQDGIYTIIPKQTKPSASTITPDIDWTGKPKGPPATATGKEFRFWRKLFSRKSPKVFSDPGVRERQSGGKRSIRSATGKVKFGKKKNRTKPKKQNAATMRKKKMN